MESIQRRAAIYCRISQDRAGEEAGVTRQEEDCRTLAVQHGWEIVTVVIDNDTSAYSVKPRPGYLDLLERVRRGEVDAIVAWHPDRLYRRMRDLVELLELAQAYDTEIATVRAGKVDLTSATGRMHASMLGAVAQYESEIKSERITRAAEQRARAGRWSGGMRPYGYEKDGITIREAEARHIRTVTADLLSGVSLRQATRRISEAGSVTATGKPWTSQRLRIALLSPRIAGLASYRGEVIGEAEWPALVRPDDWRAVKAILEDPKRVTTPGPTPRHLLSGIAVCGRADCGEKCRVSIGGGGAGRNRSHRYRCPRGHVIRQKDQLEAYVVAATLSVLRNNNVAPASPSPSASAAREADAVRSRLEALAGDFADGLITRAQFTAANDRGRTRLAELDAQIVIERSQSAAAELATTPDVTEAWASLPLARQRAIVGELWRVRLNPVERGKRGVNADGVELVPQWAS